MLAAYCKLIIHGVLEMSMAAEVFMYYMKVKVNSSNEWCDIMGKSTNKLLSSEEVECLS